MMNKAPNPIDKHVGARLRMRRMLIGMSQETLGEALGITFQQIQKYEKGANRISASRLQQLGQVLEVPAAFFFEGLASEPARGFSEPAGASYVVDFLSTAEGLQLNRSFALIRDAKVRKRILELVASLADKPGEGDARD
jgi:transcriptional regulator with XRE-family HTH domain